MKGFISLSKAGTCPEERKLTWLYHLGEGEEKEERHSQ
jgi:hypothetical protein